MWTFVICQVLSYMNTCVVVVNTVTRLLVITIEFIIDRCFWGEAGQGTVSIFYAGWMPWNLEQTFVIINWLAFWSISFVQHSNRLDACMRALYYTCTCDLELHVLHSWLDAEQREALLRVARTIYMYNNTLRRQVIWCHDVHSVQIIERHPSRQTAMFRLFTALSCIYRGVYCVRPNPCKVVSIQFTMGNSNMSSATELMLCVVVLSCCTCCTCICTIV